ncbi:hypothetical protein BAE44_0025546, partial [Dichanthelium oligosanthes]
MKMADSNKGWHPEWFYVANPPPGLPAFSGRFAEKLKKWSWGPSAEEKKMWVTPVLDLLEPLKVAGLTGVKVMWTFFERRVQPLMAPAHALYKYAGVKDPTRMSPEVLTSKEVKARVRAVTKRSEDEPDLDRHERGEAPYPAARHAKNDPAMLLRAKVCYPPLPEENDRRAGNRAKNEHEWELSQQRKKRRAERAVHLMRQAQKGSVSEESAEEDDDEDVDSANADDRDDNDDDDDDMGARYAEALGPGKRSVEEAAEDPSAKRFRAGPGQSSSGAALRSGCPLGESSSAPALMEEIPWGTGAAPAAEELLPPPPEVLPPPPTVPHPAPGRLATTPPAATVSRQAAPPVPATASLASPSGHVGTGPAVGGDPWGLQWVSRSSRAPRRASSGMAAGASGAADAAGTEPAAAQQAATTGVDEAATARDAPQAGAEVAEPPSGPAATLTGVVDLPEVTSEREDAAARLDAAAGEEVDETGQLQGSGAWREGSGRVLSGSAEAASDSIGGAHHDRGRRDIRCVGACRCLSGRARPDFLRSDGAGYGRTSRGGVGQHGASSGITGRAASRGGLGEGCGSIGRSAGAGGAGGSECSEDGWRVGAGLADGPGLSKGERTGARGGDHEGEEEEWSRLQLAVKHLNEALGEVGSLHQ